jgi:hypothetical protein
MDDNTIKWIFIVIGIIVFFLIYPAQTMVLLFLAGIVFLLIRNSKIKNPSSRRYETYKKTKSPRILTNSIPVSQRDEESFEKGKKFEEFVDNHFDKSYFTLIEWHASDKQMDRYIEAARNPDFKYRYNPKNEEFAVECKWREAPFLRDNRLFVDLGEESKLGWYRNYAIKNNIPVFMVVGFKGTPDNPEEMFCLPLDIISSRYMPLKILNEYQRYPNKNFFWSDGFLK